MSIVMVELVKDATSIGVFEEAPRDHLEGVLSGAKEVGC